MLSINNSTLTVNSINDDADDVFGMEMSYNETPVGLGNTASWNGQLTAVRWMSRDSLGNKGNERNYNYNYDQLNRLTSALYQEKVSGTWNGNGAYDEKDISYDVNGNITALKRNALLSGSVSAIDNLTYTYDSNNPNRLKNVTDGTGANYIGFGFRNLTGSTGDYAYDDNGNLVTDPYKGLSLTYNVLNRADVITKSSNYLTYTYDANGILLHKEKYVSGSLQKTTDYIDGFVYENTNLAYFWTPEGRVLYTGGKLKPQYIITDQQGNARVTFVNNDGVAKVIQENSYYAFGLIMTGGTTPATDPNKNLYNGGSEWQNDFGDLPDLMQTYYRNYDQALGRWTGVDPDAEGAESLTTYNYSGNNPVMYNDPLGNLAQQDERGRYYYNVSSVESEVQLALYLSGGSISTAERNWMYTQAAANGEGYTWNPNLGKEISRETYEANGKYYASVTYEGRWVGSDVTSANQGSESIWSRIWNSDIARAVISDNYTVSVGGVAVMVAPGVFVGNGSTYNLTLLTRGKDTGFHKSTTTSNRYGFEYGVSFNFSVGTFWKNPLNADFESLMGSGGDASLNLGIGVGIWNSSGPNGFTWTGASFSFGPGAGGSAGGSNTVRGWK